MKKLFLIYFIVCACFYCHAQQWDWARKANSATGDQFATKIRADQSGNVYILGINRGKSSYGTLQLDSGSFIVKYNSAGNFLWGTNIPGEGVDISTDLYNNVYILTNRDSLSVHNTGILKFSSAGPLQWQKFFGGQSYTNGSALLATSYGKIFVTGFYRKSTSFDNFNLTDTVNENNFFLAAINSSGNVLSLAGAPSNTYAYLSGEILYEDKNKTLYVTGYGTVCNYYNCGGIFLNKYDQFGNLIYSDFKWGMYEEVSGFTMDDSLNMYVLYSITTQYGGDSKLKKYDSSFHELWSYYLGGTSTLYNFGGEIAIDGQANIFISGDIGQNWNTSSDSVLFDTHWLKLKGQTDVAVIKINSAGNLVWIKSAGGKKNEYSSDLCLDKPGNCFLAGVFNWHYNGVQNDTVCFGSDTLINDANAYEIFITKLSELGSTASIQEYTPTELVIYPNPSNGKFMIYSSEAISIQVINILGQPVYSFTEKYLEEIDLSSQPKGIYFVEIISANEKTRKKIIIE